MRNFVSGVVAVGVLLSIAVPLRAQSPACTNSLLTGTYFYLLNGTLISGIQSAPYAELGKLVSDGLGHVSGHSTASINGAFSTYSLSGTYAVQSNCRGSMALTVNSSGTTSFTFEVVRGGDGILISFSGSSGVAVGQAYRAATGSTPCATGSLAGSYGFLLSGVAGGLFSEEGQVTSDGNGNLNVTSVVNSNGTVQQVPGSGTYSLAADCSGTLLVTSQFGNNGYLFAAVQNGQAALFLSTDAGATVSGVAQSQTLARTILPDFAFGGGFYSALYFTNQTGSAVSFPVSFFADDSSALSVPSIGGTSTTVNLAANGTAVIEAPNAGSAIVQGYVSFVLPSGVTGYGVFRKTAPGGPDQEVVVPLSSASSTTSSLSFDDTNVVTAVAIVNPSSVATVVSISALDTSGNVIGTSSVALGPNAKTESVLRNLPGLAGIAGFRGSADFTVSTGNVAVLGLRFNSQAFTSIPTTNR